MPIAVALCAIHCAVLRRIASFMIKFEPNLVTKWTGAFKTLMEDKLTELILVMQTQAEGRKMAELTHKTTPRA